jgi:hypothetical protein
LDDDIEDTAGLYAAAFHKLVKGELDASSTDGLLDRAAMLCEQTYFRDGVRALAFADLAGEEKGLLRMLLNSNVVIPAERVGRFTLEPRQVRFFHDSMQSYLTARGLFALGDWTCLFEAAGNPAFARTGAIAAEEGGLGSELFDMCIHVFRPIARLRSALTADLARWVRTVDGPTLEDMISSAPKSVGSTLDRLTVVENLMQCIVEYCNVRDGDGEPRALAAFYAAIASRRWRPRVVPNSGVVAIPEQPGQGGGRAEESVFRRANVGR